MLCTGVQQGTLTHLKQSLQHRQGVGKKQRKHSSERMQEVESTADH